MFNNALMDTTSLATIGIGELISNLLDNAKTGCIGAEELKREAASLAEDKPGLAADALNRISAGTERNLVIETLFCVWGRNDRAAATRWLAANDTPAGYFAHAATGLVMGIRRHY